ncbi:MAG: tetratricopeptide repeat protein, partial [Acidobacteria bacterium]|nr:tetratricopeptide repeat protein [Acidobacteriota bacterium]
EVLSAELEALDLDGSQRPPSFRRPRVAARTAGLILLAALLVVFAAARWVGPWSAARTADGPSGVAMAEESPAPVIAVNAFDNLTGRSELDWYGKGIARLVADSLANSSHLRVIDPGRAATLGPAAQEAEEAAAAGIGYLLTGEILPGEQGLVVAARLGATGTGLALASSRSDGLEVSALLQASDEVARIVRRGLGVPPAETVDVYAADFASANPAAYAPYLEGLEAFAAFRREDAERAFRRALELAPGFTMARYRLGYVLATLGRTDEASTELARAVGEAGKLSDREARYVRAAQAYVDRHYDEAVAAYSALVERYPYETEAWSQLVLLLRAQKRHEEQLEAATHLARLAPEEPTTWSMKGDAELLAGHLHQAVADLRRYAELAPGSANAHEALGRAYQALGELDLAAGEYGAALEADPDFLFAAVRLAVVDVLRDRRDAAETRLRDLAADPTTPPRHRVDAAFELVYLLRSEGRFKASVQVLEELEPILETERVRVALALSLRASAALELGEPERARRLVERAIERSPGVATRYLVGRGLWQLDQGRLGGLEDTVAKILAGALPPENPDRTEEKAAAYLRGLAHLERGEAELAIDELILALSLEGHEYRLYRLDLARAYLAAGRLPEALAAAHQALDERDLLEPRLDLELDRVRGLLVLSRILAALGQSEDAAASAHDFLVRFAKHDPGLAEIDEARRWAATPVVGTAVIEADR